MKIKALVCAMSATMLMSSAIAQPAPGRGAPAKADPQVAACVAKNKALDAEVDKMMAEGRKAGNISPAEAAEFGRMEKLIASKRQALARDGFSLADCESMTRSYEAEKAKVAKMAADKASAAKSAPVGAAPGKLAPAKGDPKADPQVAACVAKNKALDAEVDKMMAEGRKAGNISPAEAAEFGRMEKLIASKRQALARDGFSLADCESMTRSYEAEKAKVAKMAADKASAAKTAPPKK